MFDLNSILAAASEYVNKRIDEAVSQRYRALNQAIDYIHENMEKSIEEAVRKRLNSADIDDVNSIAGKACENEERIDRLEGRLLDLHNKLEADAAAMAIHVEDLRSRIAAIGKPEGLSSKWQDEFQHLSDQVENLGIQMGDLEADLKGLKPGKEFSSPEFVAAVRTVASTLVMEQVDDAMSQHTDEYDHDDFLTDEDDLAKAVGEYMVGYEFEQAVRSAVSELDFKVVVR